MDTKKTMLGIGILTLVLVGFFLAMNGDRGGVGEEDLDAAENAYVSEEYGFALEMPEEYRWLEVTPESSDRFSLILSPLDEGEVPEGGEGLPAITIDVFQAVEAESIDAWLAENDVSNFHLKMGEPLATELDGTRAIRYEWDGLYRGRSVALLHKGNAILLSGTYLEQTDPIYDDFDEVVSSFELR